MIGVLTTMFSWPQGIVVGNLIASLLWGFPAFLHLHVTLRKHHRHCPGCQCAAQKETP